jgi:hypothetical protein
MNGAVRQPANHPLVDDDHVVAGGTAPGSRL